MSKRKPEQRTLERREFLKTIANAGLATGLLQVSTLTAGMMMSRTSAAMMAGNVNKVVFVYIPGGTPTRNGTNLFVPSSSLVLPEASAPLESVKGECVFFSDASVSGGGGHGNTSKTLGGSSSKDTYDIELERTLGASSPFPSLQLGVQSTVGNHGYATKKEYREISYQDNPLAAFNRVFSGAAPSSVPVDAQRAQSVLDVQKAEIAALQTALGTAERERLDEHLSSIERLESRLQAQTTPDTGGVCGSPVFNAGNFQFEPSDRENFTTVSELQMDLTVLALRCNLTRVVSIMLGNHQSDHVVPELQWDDTYHQSIHGGSVDTHIETRAYLSSRMTYLIDALRSTQDETGEPLLDSTLVVQVTDMGDGNAHSSDQAPMFLAGGGAAINRGQLTQCGQHNNIFDTVTEVLGLNGQVPTLGSGALAGIVA